MEFCNKVYGSGWPPPPPVMVKDHKITVVFFWDPFPYRLDTTELYEQLLTGGPRSVAVWWRTYTHWDGV